jgi:hypothetical protein
MSVADHQGRRPASFRQPEAMDKDLKGAAGPLRQMKCTASAPLKTDGLQRTIAVLNGRAASADASTGCFLVRVPSRADQLADRAIVVTADGVIVKALATGAVDPKKCPCSACVDAV